MGRAGNEDDFLTYGSSLVGKKGISNQSVIEHFLKSDPDSSEHKALEGRLSEKTASVLEGLNKAQKGKLVQFLDNPNKVERYTAIENEKDKELRAAMNMFKTESLSLQSMGVTQRDAL